ncbi:MAG: hypothetical protein J6T18_01585 [Bacteroidaceae bacterium]|nr:hypothetical protein [Bacteroidaceae bacterium]MBO7588099.1 hypothetical protein [Bacteroidaceae bacterium]
MARKLADAAGATLYEINWKPGRMLNTASAKEIEQWLEEIEVCGASFT